MAAEGAAKEKRKAKRLAWPVTEKANELQIGRISPTVSLPVIQLSPDATLDISIVKKEERNRVLSSQIAVAHIDSYHIYIQIYTDVTKQDGSSLFVYFVGLSQFGVLMGKRINDNLSVFTGEMVAL